MATLLGERIRQWRAARKLTLAELARSVGVSEATMQRYESGVIANPPRERVLAIAEALEVTEAELMGWDSGDGLDEDVRLLARSLQRQTPEKRQQAIRMLRLLLEEYPDGASS